MAAPAKAASAADYTELANIGGDGAADVSSSAELEWLRRLNLSILPEWRSRYLNYQALRGTVDEILAADDAPRSGDIERRLWVALEESLSQAESLYLSQMSAVTETMRNIVYTLRSSGRLSEGQPRSASRFTGPAALPDPNGPPTDVKGALQRLFARLAQLESFCSMNAQGFERLCARCAASESQAAVGSGLAQDLSDKLGSRSFATHDELKDMVETALEVYAEAFTDGVRSDAMVQLATAIGPSRVGNAARGGASLLGALGGSAWSIFRLGVFACLVALLSSLSLSWYFSTSSDKLVGKNAVFIVFRTLALAILLLWMWGIDMAIWTHRNINYVFVFEYDAHRHSTNWVRVLEVASVFTIVWLVGIVLYFFSCNPPGWLSFLGAVFPPIWPLVLAGVAFILFLAYQIKARFSLLRTLLRIIGSPFTPVRFRETFFADQLVSLSIVLYDLEFSLCYYTADVWDSGSRCIHANRISQPLIAGIPALWRFLQCLKQARDKGDRSQYWNAGKYTSSMLVSLFSAFKGNIDSQAFVWLWLVAAILSTAYNFYWDIASDWGLLQRRNVASKPFLRDILLFKPIFYYVAIGMDLVLRMSWTLTISTENFITTYFGVIPKEVFTTCIAMCEILRRGMWNVFRLENEQVRMFRSPARKVNFFDDDI